MFLARQKSLIFDDFKNFLVNKKFNKNKPIKNNIIKIKTKKVKHIGECIGYRVEHKNKVFVYSGDLGPCSPITELAKNSDLLVLECAFPDNMLFPHHLTPSQCGEIATKSNARKLVLTHIYPECDKADIIKQCRKTYKGRIIKAKDFLSIKI